MSRMVACGMMVFALALPAIPAVAQEGSSLSRYREVTSVEPRCSKPSRSDEIVVCGNRRADRWRVPFIGYAMGDPRAEGISAERNRLASEPPLSCGIGAFLANCGMVGVSVGTRFEGGSLKVRPLAK